MAISTLSKIPGSSHNQLTHILRRTRWQPSLNRPFNDLTPIFRCWMDLQIKYLFKYITPLKKPWPNNHGSQQHLFRSSFSRRFLPGPIYFFYTWTEFFKGSWFLDRCPKSTMKLQPVNFNARRTAVVHIIFCVLIVFLLKEKYLVEEKWGESVKFQSTFIGIFELLT